MIALQMSDERFPGDTVHDPVIDTAGFTAARVHRELGEVHIHHSPGGTQSADRANGPAEYFKATVAG
jgi:hypothetical protein